MGSVLSWVTVTLLTVVCCTCFETVHGSRITPNYAEVVLVVVSGASFDLARQNISQFIGETSPEAQVVFDKGLSRVTALSEPESSARATEIASACVGAPRAPGYTVESNYATTNANANANASTPTPRPVFTLTDAARQAGKTLGVVTTACLCDATVASFFSHQKDRHDFEALGDALSSEGVRPDVYVGGHSNYVTLPGNQQDWTVFKDKESTLFGLTCEFLPYAVTGQRPSLARLVSKALKSIENKPQTKRYGHFTLVDAARVDHALHSGKDSRVQAELKDTADLLVSLFEWETPKSKSKKYKNNKRKLVVVGDHDTPVGKGSRHTRKDVFVWTRNDSGQASKKEVKLKHLSDVFGILTHESGSADRAVTNCALSQRRTPLVVPKAIQVQSHAQAHGHKVHYTERRAQSVGDAVYGITWAIVLTAVFVSLALLIL